MTIQEFKSIHFIGVGGIGVSALARLARQMGKAVSGSDMRQSVVTQGLEDLGCQIHIGHSADNITAEVDLVVHTEDVNETSPGFVELQMAHSLQITTLKYSQALGLFIDGFYGIGISGTNGKSTTTAILGKIMENAGQDPMVVLGSRLAPADETPAFKGNARFGQGKHFVYEADEYHRHMLDTKPQAVIITNIEEDHLDYYKDLKDIQEAFVEYIESLPEDGLVVYNFDDANTVEVINQTSPQRRKISFGFGNGADYVIQNVNVTSQTQNFEVVAKGQNLGQFSLKQPGSYNLMNALGAIVMALEQGLEVEGVKQALASFRGIWRRFETVGNWQGKPVISDYAHHPTALKGLITAAHQFYPNQLIMFVFQPHQKNRTKMLFNDFVQVLAQAEQLILPEIYFVPGRENAQDLNVSSEQLVTALATLGKTATYAADLDATEQVIIAQANNFDVLVLAGAGTIDQLARKLTNN